MDTDDHFGLEPDLERVISGMLGRVLQFRNRQNRAAAGEARTWAAMFDHHADLLEMGLMTPSQIGRFMLQWVRCSPTEPCADMLRNWRAMATMDEVGVTPEASAKILRDGARDYRRTAESLEVAFWPPEGCGE